MAEENEVEIITANVGDIVEFGDMKGKVEKVNENSVIVDITINDSFDEHEMFEKTVVNHKRYKIISEA
ncbi:DUF2187 domain-containing protein [Lacicoccus alkaliphilus]|uniref:Uncharacterized protein YkvS n=1 Tax=Lacicoccus alkaliphilus DSM 16010 TaxID=1123231 RepID=A0A1M7G3Z5_9BACL|nr:Uncharacterized protein YkvS [Salinicoccus alkaliphilus DSM 16010]